MADSPISTALNLPYFAAAAWHHNLLPSDLQSKPLEGVLTEVEEFSIQQYMPALVSGGFMTTESKNELVKNLARYSSLSEQDILKQNLDITKDFFWKNALSDREGLTIGRLDSRYTGIDKMETGNRLEHYPELESWFHAFTPAMNSYLYNVLNFRTDVKYNMLTSVQPWDRTNNNTRDQLRQAMAQNPFMNVLFQVGYYDGGTPYFHSKYTMWQLDPSGKMKDRMYFEGYKSGHMMYLRKEDLKQANQHVQTFIENSVRIGVSAKY
jgi:carboxypeptidase C (cathepsin A)